MEKMTVDEAVATFEAIKAVYYETTPEGLKERLMPFGVKYKLTKIKEAFEKEFNSYNAAREELVKKYGEEVEKEGNTFLQVKEEEKENFFKDFNDVLLTQVELSYPRLSESDCAKLEEKEIDLAEVYLRLLSKFVFE